MPTIEIAIYESEDFEIDTADFKMAIRIDKALVSHRGLFMEEFENQKGTMLHLGNPELKEEKDVFFGGKLIDWDSADNKVMELPKVDINDPSSNWGANQQYAFQFEPEFKPEIDRLFQLGISKSKINKIAFLTDYQFGPEKGNKRLVYSVAEFWDIHDKEKLVFNTIYEMYI